MGLEGSRWRGGGGGGGGLSRRTLTIPCIWLMSQVSCPALPLVPPTLLLLSPEPA